jgi:hypothetical protein
MVARARRTIDIGRLSRLVARPGVDPRVWVALARVTDVGYDENEGFFADVTMIPTGEEQTAMISSLYTGPSYGFWPAVEVGDLVVVVVPQGDPNAGPVIIGQIWNTEYPPPSEARGTGSDNTDVSPNVVLKTKGGAKLVMIAQNADFTMTANVVKMQAANQSFVRGETYADALGVFLDALKVIMLAIKAYATAAGGAVPALAPAGTALGLAIDAFNLTIDTFKNARTTYLSTKIKGE